MNTIWKFPLRLTEAQNVAMPRDARILDIQTQGETPCIWALVDDDAPEVLRTFWIVGTGNPVPEGQELVYRGTFQSGWFVGHVFEEI